MKGHDALMSSTNQTWGTPTWLFLKLHGEFVFTLDPCASNENHKCDKYFTEEQDGLSQSWKGYTVFINPPYSESKKWITKACNEFIQNNVTSVMLLPARTDTIAFQDIIAPRAAQIRFLKGRIKFEGATSGSTFPSAVVVFSEKDYDERVIFVDYR